MMISREMRLLKEFGVDSWRRLARGCLRLAAALAVAAGAVPLNAAGAAVDPVREGAGANARLVSGPAALLPDPALSSASPPMLRLPDLRTLPPDDLEVQIRPGGERELRLSNTIWNSGSGPLELEGNFDRADRLNRVRQQIYTADGAVHWLPVGEFVWHPGHDHWHMEGFAIYELWSLAPNGGLERVVASSDKVSYCAMDTGVVDDSLPGYQARRRYYACDRELQGLSAGWGDEYKSHLEGQSLDLNGVADGIFALRSTANPEGRLHEASYGNNSAVVYVEIRGMQVKMIPAEELSERRCQEVGFC